jgi:hypothetical protein
MNDQSEILLDMLQLHAVPQALFFFASESEGGTIFTWWQSSDLVHVQSTSGEARLAEVCVWN